MANFQVNKALILIHLSLLLLSSFSVLSHEDGGGIVSWALAPHSLPSLLSPAPSPKPHNAHHHHHHPKHPHAPPPAATPPFHSPPSAATPPTHHSSPQPAPTPPAHSSPPEATPPAHSTQPPAATPPHKAPTAPPPKPPTHHHHHHAPAPPPHAKPPTAPPTPVKPPSPAPSIQRKAIAVRGLVYCKSCKYRGVDNLYKATPLEGAVVKLACNNTKYHLVEKTKTDKNGFFLIMPKMVTSAGFHKCKVFLVSSPNPDCSVFTNYKLGQSGAPLIPTPPPPELKSPPYQLFTVGPFAFEPSKKAPCSL